ncbi:hypothetical protein LRH25_28395 [Ideonella azotifigens]|nr:hypothetical protein [Ideonella azotifigens]MCD2344249.1 hypothetical protein [Ideonella azotifigens]
MSLSFTRLQARFGVALLLASVPALATAQDAAAACGAATRKLPERAVSAPGANGFAAGLAGLDDHGRDRAIRDELLRGNLPGFLRHALPATLDARLPGGRTLKLTLCVLSDYLSVGSDDDHLRVPLSLDSALAVATRFGFTLPTTRMVDLIYRQAAVHLVPQPLPAGDRMRSLAYTRQHDALVEQQRNALGFAPDVLTAGHKKDLVLSARLWAQPERVAIYGWRRPDGQPIQPLSTVHGARYADYSHGVRLVSQTVFVDGRAMSIFDVLADSQLAAALSDEGPLPNAAGLLAAAAAR